MDNWEELKKKGAEHYKLGGLEPIDLFRHMAVDGSASVLWIFSICSIIKYAARNLYPEEKCKSDLRKIIHYAEIALAIKEEADAQEETQKANDNVM